MGVGSHLGMILGVEGRHCATDSHGFITQQVIRIQWLGKYGEGERLEEVGRSTLIVMRKIGSWSHLRIYIICCTDIHPQMHGQFEVERCPAGSFSMKSYYERLTPRRGIENFPQRQVWYKNVPLKVSFFVWEAVQGRVLTTDNLRR